MEKTTSENKHLDQKPPSIFQMLKSFTKEVGTYVANGAPNVSTEDYAERLDACMSCNYLMKKSMRCGLCGCVLQFKAKMKTAECPDKPSRWKEQDLSGISEDDKG
tara:strand:- start:180 stop:494 length:315 start_codon:yes stop_codon:yes gene_type:complete